MCCMDVYSQVSEIDESLQPPSEMREIDTKKAMQDLENIENSERKRNVKGQV